MTDPTSSPSPWLLRNALRSLCLAWGGGTRSLCLPAPPQRRRVLLPQPSDATSRDGVGGGASCISKRHSGSAVGPPNSSLTPWSSSYPDPKRTQTTAGAWAARTLPASVPSRRWRKEDERGNLEGDPVPSFGIGVKRRASWAPLPPRPFRSACGVPGRGYRCPPIP